MIVISFFFFFFFFVQSAVGNLDFGFEVFLDIALLFIIYGAVQCIYTK